MPKAIVGTRIDEVLIQRLREGVWHLGKDCTIR